MYWNFLKLTGFFSGREGNRLLRSGTWGLERESQRVTPTGDLALSDHPAAFGDKLENPNVTTDFSESQLELITPPFPSIEETYDYLKRLQIEVEQEIGDELLWPLSMPPRLPDEKEIPIARFNNSPEGREKEIYRKGLALRYGKKMQMISGLHYNFSFDAGLLDTLYERFGQGKDRRTFVDEVYFGVARNYLRYRWLLVYLFGSSPSTDSTYYPVMGQELKFVLQCCPECCNIIHQYEQYATSLRVSRFGYSDTDQRKYKVSFDSLGAYIRDIRKLMATTSRKFKKLGIYREDQQVQLNDYILQKESEFYSTIRFKQVTAKGETQLEALEKRGVKYLEVRILDLNPFEKVGISLNQMYFLHVFLLFCLFKESPFFSDIELDEMNSNHHLVALSGRKPGLVLKHPSGQILMKEWAGRIFKELQTTARLLDLGTGSNLYEACIDKEHEKVLNPALLPSAQIQEEMCSNDESFIDFGIRTAVAHKQSELVHALC
ncbi:MAG: glutamate--cysteine ligase [Clostridia bacterium]|nr:glutamate--cysteine ligase [Clostridia bacterium]